MRVSSSVVQDVVIENVRARLLHAINDELGKAIAVDAACLEPLADITLDVSPAAPLDGGGAHAVDNPRQGAPVPRPARFVLASEGTGLLTAVSALHRRVHLTCGGPPPRRDSASEGGHCRSAAHGEGSHPAA